MSMLTIWDARSFISRALIGRKAEDVFLTRWGGIWHFSLHSRRPGAILIGCYDKSIEAKDLLADAFEAIREHDGRQVA